MEVGRVVEVQEVSENKTLNRVVSMDSRNVYVCTDAEFKAARAQKREPVCVGFPHQFVLSVLDEN